MLHFYVRLSVCLVFSCVDPCACACVSVYEEALVSCIIILQVRAEGHSMQTDHTSRLAQFAAFTAWAIRRKSQPVLSDPGTHGSQGQSDAAVSLVRMSKLSPGIVPPPSLSSQFLSSYITHTVTHTHTPCGNVCLHIHRNISTVRGTDKCKEELMHTSKSLHRESNSSRLISR